MRKGYIVAISIKYQKDITGLEFREWKVISKSDKVSKGKDTYWLCECQLCGCKREFRRSSLTSKRPTFW